jgi:hypothetical protein
MALACPAGERELSKMAIYMTQQMSSEKCSPITYYKKQSQEHVSHTESWAFTTAAKANYSAFNRVEVAKVVAGSYKSGQGVPTGGKTFEFK